MKFHKEFRFEAPLADVYAMLADPAFREKVAAQAGAAVNLLRWTSPRSIKETFVPPKDHRYPHMGAE